MPVLSFQSINSSVFIWKYLNRTIYRSPLFEGADQAFLWHLRNKRREPNAEEMALRDEFGLKLVYPTELFYKTHKISQKDFLDKLRSASGAEKKALIMGLFEDETLCGRRETKTLKEGISLVKQKIALKARQRKFASKVSGNNEGMSI